LFLLLFDPCASALIRALALGKKKLGPKYNNKNKKGLALGKIINKNKKGGIKLRTMAHFLFLFFSA
jgi:hypothetical protein